PHPRRAATGHAGGARGAPDAAVGVQAPHAGAPVPRPAASPRRASRGGRVSAPTSPSPGRATAHEDPMTFTLRPERPDDAAAIHEVTRRAFLGAPHAAGTEAHIVDACVRPAPSRCL